MIRNRESLLTHGMVELRSVALDIVEAGLAASDPAQAVARHVHLAGDQLEVDGRIYDLEREGRIFLLGAGKASLRIAQAVEQILGERIADGVIVVPHNQVVPLRHTHVHGADHPLPGEDSLDGACRLLALADMAGPQDLVIACVTGGSSALACAPADGVSLAEKRQLHRLLLESGADITEINAVRKHVSSIKGGRLAQRAYPARVINLTLSDVAGDSLDYITDMTVQDTSSAEDAVRILKEYRLWGMIAASIREHLGRMQRAAPPDLSSVDIHTVVLLTGDAACSAMAERTRQLAFAPVVVSTFLEGESREVGVVLASMAKECFRKGRPFEPPCVLLGCGGETTVTLADRDDSFGLGGPNQEVVLGAALKLHASDHIAAVCVDSDGSDGGTDVAGAVVDGLTHRRAMLQGVNLKNALMAHRSREVLYHLDDLVVTGPTYTNVNDLFAIVIGQ